MDKVKIVIREGDDTTVDVDWTKEPEFEFGDEVSALKTLQGLREELEAAREQVRQVMRYMTAAVIAARNNGEGTTSKQAIIGESGLARQTVFTILGEQ